MRKYMHNVRTDCGREIGRYCYYLAHELMMKPGIAPPPIFTLFT